MRMEAAVACSRYYFGVCVGEVREAAIHMRISDVSGEIRNSHPRIRIYKPWRYAQGYFILPSTQQFTFLLCYILHYTFRPQWIILRYCNFYIQLSNCNVLHMYRPTYIS
jgi:hypothetical protein